MVPGVLTAGSTPGGHSGPHPAAPCSTSGLFITSQQEMMSPLFPANSSTDGSLYPDRILHLTFRAQRCFFFFLTSKNYVFFFIFIFLLYNIVLVLPYINMHLPRVYTCSPSWTPLPPPSPYHPSGSSQCTSPKVPISCIEPGLVIHFLYGIHVLMPFSQIIPLPQSPKDCSIQMFSILSAALPEAGVSWASALSSSLFCVWLWPWLSSQCPGSSVLAQTGGVRSSSRDTWWQG